MSRNLHPKTKGRREARPDAVRSNEAGKGPHVILDHGEANSVCGRLLTPIDQNSKAIEMFTNDIVDDDSESDARSTSPSAQRHGELMEWRRTVLQFQEESHARQNGKGPGHEKLDAEIKRIQQHYHEQEEVLKKEFVALELRYKWAIAELEREGHDEEYYFVDGCDGQSDYQPTECGEGSGSVMP